MPAKPTIEPKWGTDETNNVEPSVGQKASGWTPEQDAIEGYQNWWMYGVWLWIEWLAQAELNDGNTAYALSASQTDWDPTGLGNTTNVHTVAVTPSADHWVLHGLVGGVDRREIDIVNVGTFGFFLHHQSGSATAANRFAFPANVVALDSDVWVPAGASVRVRYRSATSRWHVVSMCGVMNYQQMIVPAVSFSSPNTDVVSIGTTGHVVLNRATDPVALIYMPVRLPIGAMLDDFLVYVKKLSDASSEINASLISREHNSDSVATLATDANNANAPGYTALGDTLALHVVPATNLQHFIQVTSNYFGTSDWLLHARISGWFPCN